VSIEEQIADPTQQHVGLDINDLGSVYDSIMQTTLLSDAHFLVICNPNPDEREFKFMQLAKASGHTVFLVLEKQDAPKQTRWLGLSNPLATRSDVALVPETTPMTTEFDTTMKNSKLSEKTLDKVASALMFAGILFIAFGYFFTLKAVIWGAIPLLLGSVAVTFYGRVPSAMHCFTIFWMVLLSTYLALQIG
jgi:hypothetical protein